VCVFLLSLSVVGYRFWVVFLVDVSWMFNIGCRLGSRLLALGFLLSVIASSLLVFVIIYSIFIRPKSVVSFQ
jgi:hypothetical protein